MNTNPIFGSLDDRDIVVAELASPVIRSVDPFAGMATFQERTERRWPNVYARFPIREIRPQGSAPGKLSWHAFGSQVISYRSQTTQKASSEQVEL